ncbi:transposase, partial [Olsenella phocaeensis]|uniref:transposase n=1 Tax=Olsenella phocaeensis TaxID=1852385 RepID=UPI003A8EEB74
REGDLAEGRREGRGAPSPERLPAAGARAVAGATGGVRDRPGGGPAPRGPGRATSRIMRSDVPRTKAVARTVREEGEGILDWFPRNATNAVPEGPSSATQSVKRASGGFGDLACPEAMAFLRLGRLDFSARLASGCASHQK